MYHESQPSRDRAELECVACGHAGVSADGDGDAVCPGCGETYSLVVGDGFALLEAGGWTAHVTLDVPEKLRHGIAN